MGGGQDLLAGPEPGYCSSEYFRSMDMAVTSKCLCSKRAATAACTLGESCGAAPPDSNAKSSCTLVAWLQSNVRAARHACKDDGLRHC